MTGTLSIGCAIWAYDGWTGNFYPAGIPTKTRLNAYAKRLTAVEVNSTFYALPAVATVQKWAEDTPDSFRFCPKFPKLITHTAQLHDAEADTDAFLDLVSHLGKRLGPLMLQLPPSFGPNKLDLLHFYLADLPKQFEITVEVRHPDWFKPEIGAQLDQVLAELKVARVVFDVRPAHGSDAPEALPAQEKKPDVPLVPVATQPFVIVRYISSPVQAENNVFLDEWVPRLVTWLREGRHVHFFTHCPYEELSPVIAREIHKRVRAEIEIPPLPWDSIEVNNPPPAPAPTQLSLF